MDIKVTITAEPKLMNLLERFINLLEKEPEKNVTKQSEGVKEFTKEETVISSKDEVLIEERPKAKQEETNNVEKVNVIAIEDIRALVVEKSKKISKQELKNLLEEFEAPKVSNLKAHQFKDFYEKLEAM